MVSSRARNVLGGPLEPCSGDPLTGYCRNGCCDTGPGDVGLHVVCARMTEQFLAFSASRGNDLSTPSPEMGFPGLVPGDRWCLCVERWKEALLAGCPPPVVLEATQDYGDWKAMRVVPDVPAFDRFMRAANDATLASGGNIDVALRLPRDLIDAGFDVDRIEPIQRVGPARQRRVAVVRAVSDQLRHAHHAERLLDAG